MSKVFSQQGKICRLDDDLSLYVTEQGEGVPYLLVTGWAYSTAVFDRFAEVASTDVRLIAFDPRGHGQSPATPTGHTYQQHGHDLNRLIERMDLQDITMIGWSLGVYDILCFVDQYGAGRVKKLILVDESPSIVKKHDGDWGEGLEAEVQGLIQLVRENFLDFFSEYMNDGFVAQPDSQNVKAFRKLAATLTPSDAAQLLDDATRYDFTQLLIHLSEMMPLHFVVREEWAPDARSWLVDHQLSEIVELDVLGGHLMLMEYPEDFSKLVFGNRS